MTDRITVLLVVFFLGMNATIGLGGLIWLIGRVEVKDAALLAIISGLVGTAFGALGSLLASTRSTPSEPMPVSGPAGPNDPVDTREVNRD